MPLTLLPRRIMLPEEFVEYSIGEKVLAQVATESDWKSIPGEVINKIGKYYLVRVPGHDKPFYDMILSALHLRKYVQK